MIKNLSLTLLVSILLFSCSKEEKICRKNPTSTHEYQGNITKFIFVNDSLASDSTYSSAVTINCINEGLEFSTEFGLREFAFNEDSSYYVNISTDSVYDIEEVYRVYEDRSMGFNIIYQEKAGPERIEYAYTGVRLN